ncbi:WXG100 family type VII secretion target [Streptomyces inhibens]|uniref:WXG100 family type VII secretion target n=1 Tax=Streptomyces inhibens TaxID=2293571 RepID=A0A371Q957_STRIH|nr:WXG100 family type VII secretion target [Streptomyces inhibens]REK91229.1 WXG100 family type VII secretion target [Streptomyces inhibens]
MSLNSFLVDKITPVLEMLDIPWPGGDPETLRDLAARWHTFGQDLHQTAEHLNGKVNAVVGDTWKGAAADSFKKHWQQQYKALQDTSKNFAEVRKELDAYADEAEAILKEIVEIALEIAEMELAGALLTVVTAGISDVVATAASGARAMKIISLVEKFAALAKRAEIAVQKLVGDSRVLKHLVKGLTKLLGDALKNTAMNYAGTVGTKLATGNPSEGFGLGWQDLQNAAVAGTVAAAPGALGKGVSSVGRHAAPSTLDKVLNGDGLTGGAERAQKIVSGALGSAGGTAVAEQFDPNASTVGADSVTSGITGGLGAHRAMRFPGAGAHESVRPHLKNGYEIGANGAVYAGGGMVEGTVNNGQGLPGAGPGLTDKDGAVDIPDE